MQGQWGMECLQAERSPTEPPCSPIPDLFDFGGQEHSIAEGRQMGCGLCLDTYSESHFNVGYTNVSTSLDFSFIISNGE